jgi:hypothetical protein
VLQPPTFTVLAGRRETAKVEVVDSLGKSLVVLGLVLAVVGAALWLIGRSSGGGFLPGDIVIEKKNVRFVFPIVTCLVVSAILSGIAWVMRR